MTKTILCKKLGKEAPALTFAPYPGELGQKILNEISQAAWDAWVAHQTMLINEYRLNLMDKKSRDFLQEEMKRFLFGDGSSLPPDYIKPS